MIRKSISVRAAQFPTLLTSESVTTMRSDSLIALIETKEQVLCLNLGPLRALPGIETQTLSLTTRLAIGKILTTQLLKQR